MIRLKENQVIHGRLFVAGENFPLTGESKDVTDPCCVSDPALELSLVMQDKADELDVYGAVVERRAKTEPEVEIEVPKISDTRKSKYISSEVPPEIVVNQP